MPTLYQALWSPAAIEGDEPTNDHAERIPSSGGAWRKDAFGCHGAAGCRFVERMPPVVQPPRLREREVLDHLVDAIVADRAGDPAPRPLGLAGD